MHFIVPGMKILQRTERPPPASRPVDVINIQVLKEESKKEDPVGQKPPDSARRLGARRPSLVPRGQQGSDSAP